MCVQLEQHSTVFEVFYATKSYFILLDHITQQQIKAREFIIEIQKLNVENNQILIKIFISK